MKLVELFKFVTGRPMVSKQKTREEWEEFARELYEKVGEALDYWCWNVSGDPAIVCYESHADRDLYELAEEFVDWSHFGITKEDLELLEEMPEDIYRKYSEKMQKAIEKVVESLEKKYGRPEEEF